jgi:4-amino-4-deoxy-L-arabinose transferase-like glycosyltransferase
MPAADTTPGLPAWATPLGCALAVLLLTIPHALMAARFGLVGDEAYYALWSLYPGFNYYDHSPAVAWVVWLGRAIFGEGEWPVRSMFVIAGLLTSALLYRIGDLISDDRRIGAAAAIAFTVIPAIVMVFTVATPDGPSTLFWTATVWAVAEFQRSRNPNCWLLAGAFAGLGLLSKYTGVFLGPGLLLFLLTSAERRRWFWHWQLWAGGALALALFSPVIWLNSQRDWNSFRFQFGRSSLLEHHFSGVGFLLQFLGEQALLALPTLFILATIGVVLFFLRRAQNLALPVLTTAPMLGYFLVHALFGRAMSNWTSPLFPQFALIGAYAAMTLRPQNLWRWPLALLRWIHVPLGVVILVGAYWSFENRAIPFIGPFKSLDYLYGWSGLQQKVSAIARDNGAQWVDTDGYPMNGGLGYYGHIAKDPLPVFDSATPYRYIYMPPMDAALRAAPHLAVREQGRAAPAGAEFLVTITRDHDGLPLEPYDIYIVR